MGLFLDGPPHSKCLENAKNAGGRNARFQEFESPTTEAVSRKLLKTMSDFFFCRVQPYIDVHYQAKKIEKNTKQKFKLGLKIVEKCVAQNPHRFIIFMHKS